MAKSTKSSKDRDRRAVVEQMRREQQSKERRQGLVILGAAVLVGAVIIYFAVSEVMKTGLRRSSAPRITDSRTGAPDARNWLKYETISTPF